MSSYTDAPVGDAIANIVRRAIEKEQEDLVQAVVRRLSQAESVESAAARVNVLVKEEAQKVEDVLRTEFEGKLEQLNRERKEFEKKTDKRMKLLRDYSKTIAELLNQLTTAFNDTVELLTTQPSVTEQQIKSLHSTAQTLIEAQSTADAQPQEELSGATSAAPAPSTPENTLVLGEAASPSTAEAAAPVPPTQAPRVPLCIPPRHLRRAIPLPSALIAGVNTATPQHPSEDLSGQPPPTAAPGPTPTFIPTPTPAPAPAPAPAPTLTPSFSPAPGSALAPAPIQVSACAPTAASTSTLERGTTRRVPSYTPIATRRTNRIKAPAALDLLDVSKVTKAKAAHIWLEAANKVIREGLEKKEVGQALEKGGRDRLASICQSLCSISLWKRQLGLRHTDHMPSTLIEPVLESLEAIRPLQKHHRLPTGSAHTYDGAVYTWRSQLGGSSLREQPPAKKRKKSRPTPCYSSYQDPTSHVSGRQEPESTTPTTSTTIIYIID